MNKKSILSLVGTIGITMSPIAVVLSCGSNPDGTSKTSIVSSSGITMGDIKTQITTGYSDSIKKVASGTIALAGGFSDLRTNIKNAGDKKASVIGVVHQRIANDGLQARSNMKLADQKAFQIIFKQLVRLSSATNELQVNLDGEKKSLFQVYSHKDYTALDKNTKITYMKNGVVKEANALQGETPSISTSPVVGDSDFFTVENLKALKLLTSTSPIADIKTALSSTKKAFSLQMIPSKNPTDVQNVAAALKNFFDAVTGQNNLITASSDYDVAARLLESKGIDLAFLPIDTWAIVAPSSNFLLQAARSTIVGTMIKKGNTLIKATATMGDESIAVQALDRFGSLYLSDLKNVDPSAITGTDFVDKAPKFPSWETNFNTAVTTTTDPLHAFAMAALTARHTHTDTAADIYKAGAYESLIYGKTGSAMTNKIVTAVKAKSDYKMKLSDLSDVTYGYTSTTSSASYIFPELWFNAHFTK